MKKAEYVALVVSTYRKYIDNYLKNGYITINKSEISKDKEKLMDIYNRGGFTDGYFLRHNGKEMMSYNRPNHYGVKVGKVVKVDKNKCDIKLEKGLNGKDVLEIRAKDVLNEDTYEFTLKDMDINESIISTRFKKNLKIRKNQEVFRVRNQKLIDDISRKYIKNDIKKSVSIKFLAKKGENMKIFLKDIVSDTEIECISDIIVQKADNMPVSSERIKKQLLKFSDTIFEPYIQEMDIDDDIFIPIGKINELRRKAVIDLTKKIVSSFYRTSLYNINSDKTSYNERSRSKDFYYSVLINKCEMVNVILNYPQIKRVYIDIYDTNSKKVNKLIDILHENKKQVYIALPHILRYDNIESFINEYKDSIVRSDGLLARNFEGIKIARNNKKNLIVDYNMYSFNDYAIDTFRELGVDEYTACIESSKEEINKMRDKDLELIVYGYIDVMLSAGCINKNINKCTKKSKILNIKGDKRQFKVRNVCILL